MSWRTVIISRRAKLDLRLGSMVVRGEDERVINISEIALLVIENTAVSMTGCLLCELVKSKVRIIFCDEKRNPYGELSPYYGSHDTSAKVRSQVAWSKAIKDNVWTEIVTEKIRKQRDLLVLLDKSESALLSSYLREIAPRDETNREGHAAKVYFNALFGLDFTRTDDCAINAALNYGYSVILSAVNREIASNGYITQLGLFHDNMFNPFNLASDMMEPFRPIVDKRVHEMMPQTFEKDDKPHLFAILGDEVKIEGKRQYVSNAIKIYCKSVFDALGENDVSLISFYENEL